MGARVVFLVEGLDGLGVIVMDFLGAFVDGFNGVRVGNREIPGDVVWRKRPDVAMVSTWTNHVGGVPGMSGVKMACSFISNS